MILRPTTGSLDDAFRVAEAGDVIELEAGVYETAGNWGFGTSRQWCQLQPGVRLVGAGADRTIIRLSSGADRSSDLGVRPDRDLNLLWAGAGCRVSGITFDGNERRFVATNGQPAWYVSGLRFHGRYQLEDVEVVGLRGTWEDRAANQKSIEVFGVSSQGDTGGSRLTHVRVRDVSASAYVSGIYLGATPPTSGPSLVHGCSADLGDGNQFSFSASSEVTFVGCDGRGGKYGFYNDTGPTTGVVLADCRLSGSWAAISLVAQQARDFRTRFRVRGGFMDGPRLVEIVDATGTGVPTDVVVDGVCWQGDFVTAVDNPGNCIVRVQNSVLSAAATRFRTARSPDAATRSNFGPDGQALPNQMRQVVA